MWSSCLTGRFNVSGSARSEKGPISSDVVLRVNYQSICSYFFSPGAGRNILATIRVATRRGMSRWIWAAV